MESALIISSNEKINVSFTEILRSFSCGKIAAVPSCSEAKRLLWERRFDLIIINAPLRDESGENLAKDIAQKGTGQVILIIKNEYYDAVSAAVEDYGVITVSKPIDKNIFWSSLKLAKATQTKLKAMQSENDKLLKKIEDMRIVSRAKCVLISCLNMGEDAAHRYIEKQAMDKRISRKAVAEEILKTYEN